MNALAPVDDARKIEMAREICALISEAILAERDRCAQIADEFPDIVMQLVDRPGGPPGNFMRGLRGSDIASAIRTPHLPSGAAACSADTSVATLLPATEGQSEEQNSLSTPTPSHPDSDTAGAGASAPAVPIIVMKHEDIRA